MPVKKQAKKAAPKKKGKKANPIILIAARAKKIWKKGKEKYTVAVKRASDELKKEGKI